MRRAQRQEKSQNAPARDTKIAWAEYPELRRHMPQNFVGAMGNNSSAKGQKNRRQGAKKIVDKPQKNRRQDGYNFVGKPYQIRRQGTNIFVGAAIKNSLLR